MLRAGMDVSDEAIHAGITLTEGTSGGVALVRAKFGVGKVNAAICAQMPMGLYRPSAVAFSGFAGGLVRNMRGRRYCDRQPPNPVRRWPYRLRAKAR
jgi:nucleoside phosphorylase